MARVFAPFLLPHLLFFVFPYLLSPLVYGINESKMQQTSPLFWQGCLMNEPGSGHVNSTAVLGTA